MRVRLPSPLPFTIIIMSIPKFRTVPEQIALMRTHWGDRAPRIAKETYEHYKRLPKCSWTITEFWRKVFADLQPPPVKTVAELDAEKAKAATNRMRERLDALAVPYTIDAAGHAIINKWDF